ncbi:MAG: SpoIIIAH-like family protein [Lachnospiraceae bacterium]|nr:SpoIIIAH-like family protein [Lachnospiraceae bacterium]MBQ7780682.1 SpoIIIAH-like family protein [Lachnospiraceae bacterium]
MKNILKKNQLMITALAIMIAVAGYLHFAGENLEGEDYVATAGDAQTLNEVEVENFTAGNVTEDYSLDGLLDLSEEDLASEQLTEIESMDSDVTEIVDNYLDEGMDTAVVTEGAATPAEGEIPGEAVFTGTTAITTLSEAKLEKEQVRARNRETLLEIINSTTLSDEQKQNAVDTMVEMTAIAEQEMSAEILLEAKGFTDVVVSISDGSVDVVVNEPELTDVQRAQIEDIVKRKTNVEAANIVISTVVQ